MDRIFSRSFREALNKLNSGNEDNTVTWHALDVQLAPEAHEAVEYALMEAGALGTETIGSDNSDSTVVGYFDRVPDRELVRTELAAALRIYELSSSAVLNMSLREVVNEDWLGEWKKNWQPTEIGRFIIAPPWTEISPATNRIVIRIEPGMAFGTGTHETTRLCLAAIEKYFDGASFLDVGTGTGILAIAAAKLSPASRVNACDVDEEALEIARENASANDVNRINFFAGSINETTPSADFVCANLTADVISQNMDHLIGVTCGRLVLSGILETQLDTILGELTTRGLPTPIELTHDGEWVAVIV